MDRREIGRMELIFTHIYRENAGGRFRVPVRTPAQHSRGADFTDDLIDLVKRFDTRILLDEACGDFHWARPAADAVEHYIGLDVVPTLSTITCGRTRARRTFVCGDLTIDNLPKADVIVCRDRLVHLSFDDVGRPARNFQRSGSRFFLATTFVGRRRNEDIETGWWHPLDMEAPPFRWRPPLEVVDERCTHSGGISRDKRLGLWALTDIYELSAISHQLSAISGRL